MRAAEAVPAGDLPFRARLQVREARERPGAAAVAGPPRRARAHEHPRVREAAGALAVAHGAAVAGAVWRARVAALVALRGVADGVRLGRGAPGVGAGSPVPRARARQPREVAGSRA